MKSIKKLISSLLVFVLVLTSINFVQPANEADAATFKYDFSSSSSVKWVSKSPMNTTDKTWSSAWSSSAKAEHIQKVVYNNEVGYPDKGCAKIYVTPGRFQTTFYFGFKGADSSKPLTFYTRVNSGSTVTFLESVKVNGKVVYSNTKDNLSSSWLKITTSSSMGSSSGYMPQ